MHYENLYQVSDDINIVGVICHFAHIYIDYVVGNISVSEKSLLATYACLAQRIRVGDCEGSGGFGHRGLIAFALRRGTLVSFPRPVLPFWRGLAANHGVKIVIFLSPILILVHNKC